MRSLDDRLEAAFKELKTSDKEKRRITLFLKLLKKHTDRMTYEHPIRVALLGLEAGKFLNLDANALFYSGVLHAVGKIFVPQSLLKKKKLSYKDMEQMMLHPHDSYDVLCREFPFSADVVLRHHYYQEGGYSRNIQQYCRKFSDSTKNKIKDLGKILAVINFYDSEKHRKDQKFAGKSGNLSSGEVKERLLSKYPRKREMIASLYSAKIFR